MAVHSHPDTPSVLDPQFAARASGLRPVAPVRRAGAWLARRCRERAPVIRRQLPRDLVVVLWLALLAQSMGVAWVMTDSVHTSLALVIKGAPVRPGELAVFGYAGEPIAQYYSDDGFTKLLRSWGEPVSLSGPRKGDGFVKYLLGVEGDRVEVEGDAVYLQTKAGRFAVGRCKPATRKGVPLQPIAPQTIPAGYVYVWAPHVDALDSRYAAMGLVPSSALVGRAVPLW